MVLGLRTVIYHVPDLAAAKTWYAAAFGVKPYFDEPFYVGFSIGGYELGLDPATAQIGVGVAGSVAYWGVPDIEQAVTHFREAGGLDSPIQDVGDDIRMATITDPFGNVLGLIQNPHFAAA